MNDVIHDDIIANEPKAEIEPESDLKRIVMPTGHLPNFEGKPIPATCKNCAYLDDVSDGIEYGQAFYVCTKEGREQVSNLISFPFETPQKCCTLHCGHAIDWEEEAKKQGWA